MKALLPFPKRPHHACTLNVLALAFTCCQRVYMDVPEPCQHVRLVQGPLLSEVPEWDAAVRTWMRQPPRVIDESLQAAMQQVDFVGHVANPFFKRSLPKGEAARLAAQLLETRQKPSQYTSKG